MTTTTHERRDQSTVAMKNLERQYRTVLAAKSYAVIRVDGKGFSKYTKGLQRPFDSKFTADMKAREGGRHRGSYIRANLAFTIM